MSRPIIEVCVDSLESAKEAVRGGADRLELCANLMIGGTTPSPYLIREAAGLGVPVNVLIRPRFGDFLFAEAEKEEQLEQIRELKALGASGAVVGALMPDGSLDRTFLAACREAADGLHLTLHRAFDVCADAHAALETAVSLGFDTILTSGQRATAAQGAELLAELVKAAGDRIVIMPGSGINDRNLPELVKSVGARAYHLSAKKVVDSAMAFRREGVPMGLPMMSEFALYRTDGEQVRRARMALECTV